MGIADKVIMQYQRDPDEYNHNNICSFRETAVPACF